MQLDRFSYSPGETVRVNGLHFEPGASVSIEVDGTAMASAVVSGDGSFPAPGAPGAHVVTTDAVDQGGQPIPGTGKAVTFTVEAAGRDRVAGGSGRDHRNGGIGPDVLGGSDKDRINCRAGNDRIAGGRATTSSGAAPKTTGSAAAAGATASRAAAAPTGS